MIARKAWGGRPLAWPCRGAASSRGRGHQGPTGRWRATASAMPGARPEAGGTGLRRAGPVGGFSWPAGGRRRALPQPPPTSDGGGAGGKSDGPGGALSRLGEAASAVSSLAAVSAASIRAYGGLAICGLGWIGYCRAALIGEYHQGNKQRPWYSDSTDQRQSNRMGRTRSAAVERYVDGKGTPSRVASA